MTVTTVPAAQRKPNGRPGKARRALHLSLVCLLLLVAGCGDGGFSGLYNAPLPGGADLGDRPYRITVRFNDVLDLVPQAAVKVNDVAVGRVERVRLADDGKTALADLAVNGDIDLPADAVAELRQSSLLGEKFVELRPPGDGGGTGTLGDGDVIPLDRTNRNPQVEEVLGALSLLLNGGGVEQLRDIVGELNDALAGNEPEIRALLTRVDELATTLDRQRGEIVRAIDGVHRLSGTLSKQRGHLATALDHLEPGLKVVSGQRQQLVGMLTSLRKLSGTGTRVVDASKQSLVANLRALTPTLEKLAETGADLPKAMQLLPSYPIPVFGESIMHGDYANVSVRLDLQLDAILENILNARRPPVQLPHDDGTGADGAIPFNDGDAPPPLPLPDPSGSLTAPQSGGGQGRPGGDGGGVGGLLGGLLGGG
ncbi:MCE family protein [Prauserella alba]|uniref:MCE family protein n=1 Tax=Prauserella alba TaxID=176898 RepID=A0ABP4GAK6_9PSEU|nr:MCE family protein [Prauserella alba]MCP2180564.1 phospholipid/cholesterol/gamma-HCH transport system substrate-binding protein [Prauserella alba]